MRIAVAVVVLATILATPTIADEVHILSSRGGEVGHFMICSMTCASRVTAS
jgi:hypothetical protein